MSKKCEHKFTHEKVKKSTGEWLIIYCVKCGVVSFDQAKHGVGGEYQKRLTNPIYQE